MARRAHGTARALQRHPRPGLMVGDGAYLFVGLSTAQLHEMEDCGRRLSVGPALAMLLALAGGAAMSLSSCAASRP